MSHDVRRIVEQLGLEPHPEGGFFRETFRSSHVLRAADGTRSASTAIYFLLPAGVFSAFHRIEGADEMWHLYGGDSVEIHTIGQDGDHQTAILGHRLEEGERPQLLVPAGTLQAALALGPDAGLCGCTVSPGFDFADFVMPTRKELLERFPQHADLIRRLTR
ncbi:MAG TPA: cupin domain-containing protein [Candidatus Eisenbacteria bacterium]|nr:cupin domain-containing protein [Candidatus Eisenbacteria bacterium]